MQSAVAYLDGHRSARRRLARPPIFQTSLADFLGSRADHAELHTRVLPSHPAACGLFYVNRQ